jgi:hypothetical protein
MSLQIFELLRRPPYAAAALGIASAFGAMFLYFNEFLFVAPYFVLSVPASGIGLFALDILLSALSGVVMALSTYQLRNFPRIARNQGKVGLSGIVVAIVAGACPCYYLVPLLAVAGGAGGALVAVGILFEAYQLPIKLFSLALLGTVVFTLERSLRAMCEIQFRKTFTIPRVTAGKTLEYPNKEGGRSAGVSSVIFIFIVSGIRHNDERSRSPSKTNYGQREPCAHLPTTKNQ